MISSGPGPPHTGAVFPEVRTILDFCGCIFRYLYILIFVAVTLDFCSGMLVFVIRILDFCSRVLAFVEKF